jgi:hypothetical protein
MVTGISKMAFVGKWSVSANGQFIVQIKRPNLKEEQEGKGKRDEGQKWQ